MTNFNYSLSVKDYTWKNALCWGNFIGHCKRAEEENFCSRIVHILIATALFLPIISQIASVFEKIIVDNFRNEENRISNSQNQKINSLDVDSLETPNHLLENIKQIKTIDVDPDLSDVNIDVLNTPDYLFRAQQNGKSQEGCRGGISVKKAKKVWQKLQERPAPGISFDSTIIDTCSTIIGTCTAMSIEFASSYFSLRKEMNNISPGSQQFQDRLRDLKNKFETSSDKMRSKQMAYSSITVDPKKNIDISKNKIESCVRSHDFEISYSSSEMEINLRDSWIKEINNLPIGVYFIRMIKPAKNNHKLEERGHSMIYIHETDAGYFFDNNTGLEKIFETREIKKGNLLYERLLSVYKTWDIPMMRFYRLEEKN